MEIKFIELELQWPKNIGISNLRYFILGELKKYGVPLRWSITCLNILSADEENRGIIVEAVVLKS